MPARTDRAAERVQRRARSLVSDFRRNILVTRIHEKSRERTRDVLVAHSTFAPDALTTLAHFATSDRMYAATSCGVPESGSAPCARNFWRTSGICTVLTTAGCSFAM